MCEKSWAFPAVRKGGNHPAYSSREFGIPVPAARWNDREGGTTLTLNLFILQYQNCLTIFLHIQCHHRKSSPEGNSVPNLSESDLKLSGAGPGINPWAASVGCTLGWQQHSQKNSQYSTCKLPSITRGRTTKPEAAQCIWEVTNLDLIIGIHRFWVKLVPWLPVLWGAQGSDQIWPYKEIICFSVVCSQILFLQSGTWGTKSTFHPAPAE